MWPRQRPSVKVRCHAVMERLTGLLSHSLFLTHSSSSQPHVPRHAHPPCPRRPHDRPAPRFARPSVPHWPHPRPRPPPPTRPTATWAGAAPTSFLEPGASSVSAWRTAPCGAGSPGSSTCGATHAPRSVVSRRPGAPSTSGESHSSGFLSLSAASAAGSGLPSGGRAELLTNLLLADLGFISASR